MAKKMNPGADATLVSAAYRASMENAPADYGKTLQSAADSYTKTMEASSETWSRIATTIGVIGADMKASADELANYASIGQGLDSDGASFVVDELYSIKDEIKSLGFFDFSRETRIKKAELKQKQKNLFNEIDLAVDSLKIGTEAVANGLYDEYLSPHQAKMTNAIIKSNLKDKVTATGEYAKLARDEKTGELTYTMYDAKTNKIVNKPDGTPQTMTIKEFNKNIKENSKDTENATGTYLGGLETQIINDAVKSKSGDMDDQTRQMVLNNIDNSLKTDTDIKRAMMSKYGISNTSFYEDIQKSSTLSAGLYTTLMNATGQTENGEIIAQGVLENVKDLDGSGGISAQELQNAANYTILSANIISMKDSNVSKELFKEYTAERMSEAHEYGYSKRTITGSKTDSTDSGGFSVLKGSGKSEIGADDGNGYIPNSALNTIGKKAHNRDNINIGANNFIWDKDEKVYKINDTTVPNKLALFDAIYGSGFDPKNILSMYNSIEDWQADTRLEGTFDEKSGLNISVLEQDDNDVVTALNSSIAKVRTEQNPEGYHFDITRNMFGVGDFTNDAIVLLDQNNNPVKFPKGHKHAGKTASLYTDQSKEADKQASFDYLMEILEHFNLKTEKKELTAADYAAGK